MVLPGALRFLVLSAFLLSRGTAVNHTRCDGSGIDRLHLTKMQLMPENPQPGSRLCVSFEAAPEWPVRTGAVVRVTHAEFTIEQPLCQIKGLSCPIAAGATVQASICRDVPLTAVLLAGQRLEVRTSVIDEAGAPIGCLRAAVFIDDTIGVLDPDLEEIATQSHAQLRTELNRVASNAHGAVTTDEERAEWVRPLLRAAYEASPHWAELYTRWRDVHGSRQRRSLEATPAEGAAQRVLSEAASFTTFRSNLLHAYHAGRRIELDERSDLQGDVRRTLSHFA